jgi:transcriptional antiterminator
MTQMRLTLLSLSTLCLSMLACNRQPDQTNLSVSNEAAIATPVKQGNKWRFNQEITFELRSLENSITNFYDLQKKAINDEPYHAFADILDQHVSKMESLLHDQNEGNNALVSELKKLKSLSKELHNSKNLQAKETFSQIHEWIHQLHSQFEFDYN